MIINALDNDRNTPRMIFYQYQTTYYTTLFQQKSKCTLILNSCLFLQLVCQHPLSE